MRLLFTRGKNPLSKIIALVTGEDCTHMLMLFEQIAPGLMFQSNLLGTRPYFYKHQENKLEVMHAIDIMCDFETEKYLYELCRDKYDGKPYDFKGALYVGYRKILQRLFKVPMPEVNRWQSEKRFFCNELFELFNQVDGVTNVKQSSMDTPHSLWLKLERLL